MQKVHDVKEQLPSPSIIAYLRMSINPESTAQVRQIVAPHQSHSSFSGPWNRLEIKTFGRFTRGLNLAMGLRCGGWPDLSIRPFFVRGRICMGSPLTPPRALVLLLRRGFCTNDPWIVARGSFTFGHGRIFFFQHHESWFGADDDDIDGHDHHFAGTGSARYSNACRASFFFPFLGRRRCTRWTRPSSCAA